ncbi:MAG: TonB-dependent receptor, partial [Flavobacteriaceae bacterium]|nr:TonB-dependent receptor [Flavobacteriaceae bacterium]
MKKLFFLFTLIISTYNTAQQNSLFITGIIIDSESSIPLEYATISILSSDNSKILYGGITDLDGNFSLEVSKGLFDIKIEYISFKQKLLKNVNISNSLDLGIIELSIDENILDEVEVIGEKTEIQIKLDKTVYNIGKDLTLKGSSVSDVLDNLPSIEVDIEGNVSLRGNQSVRILINGKPSGLVGISS